MTEDDAKFLVYELFIGWTCYHHLEVKEIIGNYVLVHHRSHREWVDRMTGAATCRTYYALVSSELLKYKRKISAESEAHLYMEGRMNKARMETVYDYCRKNAKDGGKNTASEENRGSDSQGKGNA